jgi:S-DNA-T family DNA segregation ATPase FtsK/SpoIIIE
MDPYGVEFGGYSRICNHFLASLPDEPTIVSNSSQAVRTLNSLVKEMNNRYDLLRKSMSRNIKEYNDKFNNRHLNPMDGHSFMPYIVVMMDEYGDFIAEKGKEIEEPIVQLAQYSRAVGIHLVISTKRPTNDVITGAIKVNIPTRIAFRVPERIDSQVILDCNGAEELHGNGDMLFRDERTIDCTRVQGAIVNTSEVRRICIYISAQQGFEHTTYLPEADSEDDEESGDFAGHLDPMFEECAKLVVSTQQGSTSMLQRNFSIGYNRAEKIMNQLQKAGIVGAQIGAKPRDVLVHDFNTLESIVKKCYVNSIF